MKTYAYFRSCWESINAGRMLAGVDKADAMDNEINDMQNENQTVDQPSESGAGGPSLSRPTTFIWESAKADSSPLTGNAAKGGPLIPREKRGFCLQKKKPTSFVAIAPSSRNSPSQGLAPITPVLEVGRRIPAPDAPMAEKLECVEWLEYYERKGMLDWARRECNL